ncbi:MAG: arginase family protein [Fibrobacter sp.]|nr:arginase family protein [Fibrobacter sp.]
MEITVQDFTGVYAEQPFMQGLRNAAKTSKDVRWLDCTKIVGTDCYCDDDAIKEINELIDNAESCNRTESKSIIEKSGNSANVPAIHFFDNGNYHYMSKLWTDRVQEPFTLIVFDHHPDMQPPRFGGILSCGGWVKEVLENNKFVQSIIIIGVKEELVETACEELSQSGESNILDKVIFIRESELNTLSPQTTLSSFVYRLSSPHSLYISIDKDALAPAYAATNWDQGSLTLDALKECISTLAANHKILGIDICGERAQNFEGDANHTVQEADSLNDSLNRELVEFLQKI